MNDILKNTHKKINTQLMAARDFTYHRARVINRLKNFLFCIPVLYLIAVFINNDFIFVINTSISIFIISLFIAFISLFLKRKIALYKKQSEYFRERYDCNVLNIEYNDFLQYEKFDGLISYYADKEEKYNALRERFNWLAKLIGEKQTGDQYEIWYGEYFSNQRLADVLSCQCDNIIYSKYLYELSFRWYAILLILLILLLSVIFTLLYLNQIFTSDAIIEITIAFWSVFTESIMAIKKMFELYHKNIDYLDIIEEQKDHIKANQEMSFRMIQNMNFMNRTNDVFVPKVFRDWEFREGSKYRIAVKQFKDEYFKEDHLQFSIPQNADEIEIYTSNERDTLKLSEIQYVLKEMVKDIIIVLEANAIPYSLDGGTLLGAVRSHSFLYWDDDADLAIPEVYCEQTKQLLSDALRDKYVLQDSDDSYYSPRLSAFRIREKNYLSAERDSNLYPQYHERGLFVDVYTYSYTRKNRIIEYYYRQKMRHMFKLLTYYERLQMLQKYKRYKMKYQHVIQRYLSKATDQRMTYTPGYINNINIKGPYLYYQDLFNTKLVEWEKIMVAIPVNYDKVLKAYYGKDYLIPLDDAKTIMKHYRYIDTIK